MVENSFYSLMAKSVEKHGDSPALFCLDSQISYNELNAMIYRVASFLKDNGAQNSTVSICLPNIPAAVAAVYACDIVGANINMLHPLLPYAQIQKQMQKLDSKILFTLDTNLARLEDTARQLDILIISCSPADNLLFPLSSILKLKNRAKSKVQYPKVVNFKSLLKNKSPQMAQNPVPVGAKNIYLHSGGTLGEPKTIVLSSLSFNNLALRTPHMFACSEEEVKNKRTLMVLPMFHGFGLCMCLHAMLIFGASVVLIPRFDSKKTFAKMVKTRANTIIGVPTLFEKLMNSAPIKADLSFLTNVFVGGDILTKEFEQRFNKFLSRYGSKTTLMQGFGQTECVTVCAVNTLASNKPQTCGQALPDMRLSIVDSNNNPLPPNSEGELCVCSDTHMQEYFNDPVSTQKVFFTDSDGNRWLKTGDMASLDEQGYLYFKQRINRIFKVSGYKVFPSEIEQALVAMPQIKDAAVTMNGDILCAHIVLNQAQSTTEAELSEQLSKQLPYWSVPKSFKFLNELPQTLVGKTDYKKL